MEQYHRKLINNCMSDLIHVTSGLETIVDNLLEKNVINEWMKNYILEDQGLLMKKTKLYELIQGRGPEAFTALCRVLEETNNTKALDILISSKTSEEEEQQLSPNELLNTTFEKTILEHDDSYVKIHPERKFIENDYEGCSDIGVYPMRSNPKGHALILNINNIKDKDQQTGLEADTANLNKLFKGLGFIVHSKADLTEKDIKNVIYAFFDICHSEKANCIVVFIMCHGEAGSDSPESSDTEDGITININWLIEQFIHKKIPVHTPKLFFIDACRGVNNDFGWKYCNAENYYSPNNCADMSAYGTITDLRYEDVFIAYATIAGYTANRDPIDGSSFIQTLCQVIRKNAHDTELTSMMRMVDIELEKQTTVEHGFQTIEWSIRGFNKKFFFNPGLYDNKSDQNILTTTSINSTDA